MIIAAAWFALFAIPVFFAVPEIPALPESQRQKVTIFGAYRELFRSIAGLWRNARQTLYFLIASAVFRDGLAGVFTFGGVIAALSFGFDSSTVIIFAIAANVVAGLATILMGLLEDRLGVIPVLDLDHQPHGPACEVGNEWTNGKLADKLVTAELPVFQRHPQRRFGGVMLLPKQAGARRGVSKRHGASFSTKTEREPDSVARPSPDLR